MSATARLSITFCIVASLIARSDAFMIHQRINIIDHFRSETLSSPTLLDRCSTNEARREESTAIFAKKDGSSNNDDKREYTKIEDGSPLGVAIVLLGSLVVLRNDDLNRDPDSVWIVFATASAAAGLARLIRYFSRDKNM